MSAGEQWLTEINNVGQNYKHSDCFAVDFYCHISYLLVESKAGEIFSKVVERNGHLSPVTDSDAAVKGSEICVLALLMLRYHLALAGCF